MPPNAWPLSEVVIEFAEQVSRSTRAPLAEAGRRALGRLRQPLCVAVIGRVSAGKSTLLNALLETAISPTDGRECTEVVSVFRYAMHTTAVANPRAGGKPVPVALDGTTLPSTLPIPPAELRNIEVTLPVGWLRQASLVDTPGLASLSAEKSARTERLVADTEDAAVVADAVLFCVNSQLKDDEEAAVRRFKSGRAGTRLSGGTAVGVLTKADQLCEDRRQVWKQATEQSRSMSVQHADLFSVVVPVVGLLAETATTGALRERHARALDALARAWQPDTSDVALSHVEMFRTWPGPVEAPATRQELVDLLGLYGIAELLDALRTGTPAHAAALTTVAREVSGFDEMSARLRLALGERADVLKAAAALDELIVHALAVGDASVHDRAQSLLDRDEMFPLRVMELAQYLARQRVRPPSGLAEEAWIAVTTGLPSVSAREAAKRAAVWREWAGLTDAFGQHVARTMVRAWQLAARAGRRGS